MSAQPELASDELDSGRPFDDVPAPTFADLIDQAQGFSDRYSRARAEAIRTEAVDPTALQEMRRELDAAVYQVAWSWDVLGRPEDYGDALSMLPAFQRHLTSVGVDPATGDAFDDLPATEGQWDGEPPEPFDDWRPRDLSAALDGDIEEIVPTLLRTEANICVLYSGQVNGLHGESGAGKTWVALILAAQEVMAGRNVVWIDLEDPNEMSLVTRLLTLGVTRQQITDHVRYLHPDSAASTEAVDVVIETVCDCSASAVIIDSIGEAFSLEGINEDKDVEVGPWIRRVLRPLADTGVCVLAIDHGTKAADNPLYPSGSKRKRAAITGASYLVTAPKPLTRESGGTVVLTTAKDRHGHHEKGKVAARIEFTVYPDEGMTWKVYSPSAADDDRPMELRFAANAAVKAVKEYQEQNGGDAPSARGVLAAMAGKFKGSTEIKRAGLELAISSGSLRTEEGPRNATLHHYVRDFPVQPTLVEELAS